MIVATIDYSEPPKHNFVVPGTIKQPQTITKNEETGKVVNDMHVTNHLWYGGST